MHRAYRHQLDLLQSLDDAIGGQRTDAMRLPWDEVRDYLHDCAHYIGSLDTAAEKLAAEMRSAEHTSELQSLMRNSYAVFCLKKQQQLDNKLLDKKTKSQTEEDKSALRNYTY